jgi:hypothetical protein
LGIDLYDFDARMYDPFILRTPTHDPNAEDYPEMSPYSFLENNPINAIDPSGMDAINFGSGSSDSPVHAICETCPKDDPKFKPYIDDPNHNYIYDPKSGEVSILLDEVTVKSGLNWAAGGRAAVRAFVPFGNDIYPDSEEPGYDPNKKVIALDAMSGLPIGPSGGIKGIKTLTQLHHSFPKFLGGLKNQKLTKMSADLHKALHKELNAFLRRYGMTPSKSNPGRLIRENHSGSKIQKVLTDFYNGPGAKFKEAATDFFKYIENLPK